MVLGEESKMGLGMKILLGILGIFGVYLFFRIAGLAIAKSWRQVFYSHKDCIDIYQPTINELDDRNPPIGDSGVSNSDETSVFNKSKGGGKDGN